MIDSADVETLYHLFLDRKHMYEVRGDNTWLVSGDSSLCSPPDIAPCGWDSILWPYVVERK